MFKINCTSQYKKKWKMRIIDSVKYAAIKMLTLASIIAEQ